MYFDRGLSWEIRQIKVHPGVGWRSYPWRNQFCDSSKPCSSWPLWRAPFSLIHPKFMTLCVWPESIWIDVILTTPCVWLESMYISTQHGPQERFHQYQDYINHHCFLLTLTVPQLYHDKHKDRIHTVIPPILFNSLPMAGFDCIWLFPPLVMIWDVCVFVRATVNTAAYKKDSLKYKRNTLWSPKLQLFPNHR